MNRPSVDNNPLEYGASPSLQTSSIEAEQETAGVVKSMSTPSSDLDIRTFERIAVLNRGESAMRFLRALREYNFERGCSMRSVAFVTEPDTRAPFVHMADEIVSLGPPLQPLDDGSLISAYCHHAFIIEKIKSAGCDAVWPGWGFVSEDSVFVELLEREGITFLGPSSLAMVRLGDKIESKRLAEESEVPLAPWSVIEPTQSNEEILQVAERIGYPLMVKASAGGGGRGIRKVRSSDGLLNAVVSAREEVRKVFGQGGLFVESCIESARHIEVQFVVGIDGAAAALGIRDCSIQRRNQKVIEEGPSPVLTPESEQMLALATKQLVEKAGYRGVGTAEFLYNPQEDKAFFLEVNSRLQVEHTVTEMLTGCDLVKAQIDIARGLPWADEDVLLNGEVWEAKGHAVEVRLNAENPEQGFRPSPGFVQVFRAPFGPGIRVDNGVIEGMSIAPQFDSMIAKVIAWAPTRKQAIARLTRALRELEVVVEDGTTNKAFLLELLEHPSFVDGSANTSWLDGAVERGELINPAWSFEALTVAAILEYRRQWKADLQRFFAQVQNGIPQDVPQPLGRQVHLRLREQSYALSVYALGNGQYRVGTSETLHDVTMEFLTDHSAILHDQAHRHQVLFAYGRAGMTIEIDGTMHAIERASGGRVKAPSPAMVVHVAAEEGDLVAVGDLLCTLEAMKMEMPVYAQEPGKVHTVLCQPNQQVHAGQVLMVIEPAQEGDEAEGSAQADIPLAEPRFLERLFAQDTLKPSHLDNLNDMYSISVIDKLGDALRSVFLGFDLTPVAEARIERLFGQDVELFEPTSSPSRWTALATCVSEALSVFVDVEALFERSIRLRSSEVVELSPESRFYEFCRRHQEGESGVSEPFAALMKRALRWFGVHDLTPSSALREALWRMAVAHAHNTQRHRLCSALLRLLMGLHYSGVSFDPEDPMRDTLARVAQLSDPKKPFVADNARQAAYVLFEQSRYVQRQYIVEKRLHDALADYVATEGDRSEEHEAFVSRIVRSLHSLLHLLMRRANPNSPENAPLTEAMIRRLYPNVTYDSIFTRQEEGVFVATLQPSASNSTTQTPAERAGVCEESMSHSQASLVGCAQHPAVLGMLASLESLPHALSLLESKCASHETDGFFGMKSDAPKVVELFLCGEQTAADLDTQIDAAVSALQMQCPPFVRLTISWCNGRQKPLHRTYQPQGGKLCEVPILRDIHPEAAARIELWRLREFSLERLDAPEQIYAFRATARENVKDERVFVFAEVRNMPEQPAEEEHLSHLWEFETAFFEGLRVIRDVQSKRQARRRFHWNSFTLFSRTVLDVETSDIGRLAQRFEPHVRGLGLQHVIFRTQVRDAEAPNGVRDAEFVVSNPGRHRIEVRQQEPTFQPVHAVHEYDTKVVRARQLGTAYPYEIIRLLVEQQPGEIGHTRLHASPEVRESGATLHPDSTGGRFVEYELDEGQTKLIPVHRPYGENPSGVVIGLLTHETIKAPEGMTRVWIASDPTRAMGALAEPECRRILAAIDLAEELQIPIEWIPISAGARIAMTSGTENLDWTAKVLRRIIQFTQNNGVIHLMITGVNVGAQSYWNAEATMLMHTRGALIMTPNASMVLTGKKALEVSGSVAAEDERGIGGFERIMGPNGQAQYFAENLGEAYQILFEHYRFSYTQPGEAQPRRFPSTDPIERSILDAPYQSTGTSDFQTIGEIFDERINPGRKKPFAIREVMSAVIDQDGGHLERFQAMRHAETAVVWDAHMGGYPVCLIGFESQPQERRGRIPMDGPDTWTGGTLYPQSSKKVAWAINAASGNRPVVVMANLSGFDGSPESLRKLQLEMGAEIGRAVVNFQGSIVFVVVGRYHGGAYVVFSKSLNPQLTAIAVEGSFASVIGGAPAAAVVFPYKARQRAEQDPRLLAARKALAEAPADEKPQLREKINPLYTQIVLEKQGEIAKEFDSIHTVERAVSVGSIDAIVSAASLRPSVIRILEGKSPKEHV